MAKIGRLWRLPVFLICVVLLSTLATPAVGAAVDQPAGRIHPYLLNQAKEAPQAWVDVIVARRKGASEEAIEKASGGKRVKSWSFVNATQLRMPAAALERLAKLPGVAAIAPNAPMQPTLAYDQNAVMGNYHAALQIQPFWQTPYLGDGIGVAVIDSGVAPHPDLQSHTVNVVLPSVGDWQDAFGHGTHVAGIIAGDAGDGQRIGIAPHATIYNLRVTDNNGMSSESAVISALEWVYNNHQKYNIRVVNISMQSTVAGSYLDSPLSGAVEKLWFAGVVVVVSAGNRGDEESAAMYAPASDPYVITVGAADDAATKETGDDRFVFWSSRGLTLEGLPKPDVLAPGRLIKSTLAPGSVLAAQYPAQVEGDYLTISGSSMASPVIAGAVAEMLQFQPGLSPDQVKWALVNSPRTALLDQPAGTAPAPTMAQVYAVIADPEGVPAANQGLTPSTYADPDTSFVDPNIYFTNIYFTNIYFTNSLPARSTFDN